MNITANEIAYDLGFNYRWTQKHFCHISLDYVVNRKKQYPADKMLKYAREYRSTSKNHKQVEKSMQMMKQLIEYLETK